jgi:hypothetical protein
MALMVEAEYAITDAYRDVNAEMIKRGVLIEIKDILIRNRTNPREAERQAAAGGSGIAGGVGGGVAGGVPSEPSGSASVGGDSKLGSGTSGSSRSRGHTTTAVSSGAATAQRRPGTLEVRGPAPVDQLRHTGIHDALRSDQLAAIAANIGSAGDAVDAAVSDASSRKSQASGEQFDASTQIALEASVSVSTLKIFEAIKQHDALKAAGGDVWNLLLPAYIALAEHHGGLDAIREDMSGALTCLNRFADYIAAVQPRPDSIDERYESMLRVAEWLVSASRISDNAFTMAAEKLEAALDQFENDAAQARAETKTIADFEVLDEAR